MRITLGSHLEPKGDHGSSMTQAWHSSLGLPCLMPLSHKLWPRLLLAVPKKHSLIDVCSAETVRLVF